MTINHDQLFVFILVVHFLADFALQTTEQAEKKSTNSKQLLFHVLTYSMIWSTLFLVLPIKEDYNTVWGWLLFTFGILAPHYFTDLVTSRTNKPYFDKKDYHNGFAIVGWDQVIHYLCLWFWLKLFLNII